jgi:hypothetical protein
MMHRRILKGEQWKWYLEDLALPFIIAIIVAGAGKLLIPSSLTRFEAIVGLLIISAVTFLSTIFSTRVTRDYFIFFSSRAFTFLRNNNRILQI